MATAVPPFLVVVADGRQFGIETARIRTVLEPRTLTAIPGRPRPFLGALNLYGELLPVASLASLLGVGDSGDRARSAVVVVAWEDAALGLLVDRTQGLVGASDEARPAHVLGRWEGPHLAASLDVEGQMIHLLDVDSILADVGRRL